MIRKISVRLFLASVLLLGAMVVQAAGETYTFGVVPQSNAKKLLEDWKPILDHLSQKTQTKFKFTTAKDIPTFNAQVLAGAYDFMYHNPHVYVTANEAVGYTALAHAKDKKIKGIIVVAKDSPYQSLKDLQQQKLAFPKGAFAAELLPRAQLIREGVEFQSNYTKTHDNAYQAVAEGLFAASGGVMRTFNATKPEVKEKLRVLWTSPGYTPHAFAAHPRVPKTFQAQVQALLVGMSDDAQLLAQLKKMKLKGIQAAGDANWDDVRALAPFLNQAMAKN